MSIKALFRSNEIGKICGESREVPRGLKMLCLFSVHLSQSKRLGGYVLQRADSEDFPVLPTVKHIQEVKALRGSNSTYIENIIFCVTSLRLLRKVFLLHNVLARDNFDVFNAQRVCMLDSLWSALRPGIRRSGLISKDWTDLGFQGNDPSTDFRGTGMLGLHQLVYFAQQRQQAAVHILEESSGASGSCKFPFAITGISITHFVMELFGENRMHKVVFDFMSSHPYEGTAQGGCTEDVGYAESCYAALNDLYCLMFEEFYMLWKIRKPTDIMAFQIIFQELQTQMRMKMPTMHQVVGLK